MKFFCHLQQGTRGRIGLRGLLLLLLGLAGFLLAQPAPAGPIIVVPIQREIDLGVAPFLARALRQAAEQNARAVILEINTPGGRLDAVLRMREAILDSPVRTVAYVNREAFSAGALVALAAREIYLAPGAVMGAATPVTGAGRTADPKTISAVRSTFRSTAELRGRDPLIAEAMVDPAVAIPGLVRRGELLTLTTVQARQRGYADGVAENRAALLRAAGLADVPVREARVSPAENLVRFLTNPLVASLLTAAGFLLILADVYTGGFGLLGGAGIALITLFFWGHFLAGLAGWEGVALVVVGLALIALEVFVLPGFGIAGLAGVAAFLGGLFLSLVGGEIVTGTDLTRAALTLGGTFAVMLAGSLILLRLLPRAAAAQGLVLQSRVGMAGAGPVVRPPGRRGGWLEGDRMEAQGAANRLDVPEPPPLPSLRGAVGTALSDLRPGGLASIGGARVDVVSQGDYIQAGETVEVVADEGYRRVVRRVSPGRDSTL